LYAKGSMSRLRLLDAVLTQTPLEPITPPWASGDPRLLYLAISVGVLLLLVLLIWLLRRRRKASKLSRTQAAPTALPEPGPVPKVELPATERELARRQEVEEARREAEALAQRRREAAQAAREGQLGPAERQRLEAEASRLKEEEEAKKREEYQAKKALEKEERERHAREREEQARLEQEALARARQEAEIRARAVAVEEARKVQAQAGQTLAFGLDKTRTHGFMAKLNSLWSQPKEVNEAVLADLEEVLFTADIGVKTASKLVDNARARLGRKELSSGEKLKAAIREDIQEMVSLPVPRSLEGGGPPHVVMVVGVNGSGKTTTIGKLAAKLTGQGKKVVLAAGDTFRAAAAEQLDVWAERAKAELVKGKENTDPGAVVFDGVKKAVNENADVVIADTAGRLHTQLNLMEELKKVKRVMGKALDGAPHEVLLVLDSTNGQNAIAQAKQFNEAVGITAIALTKLDGTAKGGVVIGICDELKVPVVWVGVGEKIEDLRRFEPKEFVDALFE
jgi:fused signal recognition particle receptor